MYMVMKINGGHSSSRSRDELRLEVPSHVCLAVKDLTLGTGEEVTEPLLQMFPGDVLDIEYTQLCPRVYGCTTLSNYVWISLYNARRGLEHGAQACLTRGWSLLDSFVIQTPYQQPLIEFELVGVRKCRIKKKGLVINDINWLQETIQPPCKQYLNILYKIFIICFNNNLYSFYLVFFGRFKIFYCTEKHNSKVLIQQPYIIIFSIWAKDCPRQLTVVLSLSIFRKKKKKKKKMYKSSLYCLSRNWINPTRGSTARKCTCFGLPCVKYTSKSNTSDFL